MPNALLDDSNTTSLISRKLLPFPKTSKVIALCFLGMRPSRQRLQKPTTSAHRCPPGRTSCPRLRSHGEYHALLPREKKPVTLRFRESMINLCESNRRLKGSVHHTNSLQNSTSQFQSGVHTNPMLKTSPSQPQSCSVTSKSKENQFPCYTNDSNFTSVVAP